MPRRKKGRVQQVLSFIRHFRAIRGTPVVDMMEVASAAIAAGFRVPNPISPCERLAHEFANVARMEKRTDEGGFDYRVNQALTVDTVADGQLPCGWTSTTPPVRPWKAWCADAVN